MSRLLTDTASITRNLKEEEKIKVLEKNYKKFLN